MFAFTKKIPSHNVSTSFGIPKFSKKEQNYKNIEEFSLLYFFEAYGPRRLWLYLVCSFWPKQWFQKNTKKVKMIWKFSRRVQKEGLSSFFEFRKFVDNSSIEFNNDQFNDIC